MIDIDDVVSSLVVLTAIESTGSLENAFGTIITIFCLAGGMLILFGILGFVASFAVSLGPIMWVLFSELFPNRLRGLAISFAGFILGK